MSKKIMNLEPKNEAPKNQEPRGQDIKLEETKKPQNLRANAMPVDGFVLSVDGKLKTRYENSEDATAAAAKLKQNFPVIQVAIYDAAARLYTPVGQSEESLT